ncbi:protein-L-isoaspartate O-methyltransferase family protein [Rhodopseudomonas pseudopalustris]|uniref:Protein-L-isoaspartate O-methyltransferase n=1 Tax=Rhodopseudomonas pseudopalustris TaxID=1513892 RepID=A0A1H8SQ87_9BRAD|nr:protein-L-isoaspartate O-methyltransferase [Rhodopseudomonas pseudopalustris]SEO80940.1 protein-L-isoaspartate(D-aspartate) O-methyltransferase [Rhodopseudomonas pseudopalustris]
MLDFARARQNMVDGQIRPSSVTDWRIIDAMRAVPREAFVSDAQKAMAYLDLDLDVGGTGANHHFLLNPTFTARMLQAAEISQGDRVLVAGGATGYVAALAAKLAERVVTTIDDESMAARATATLAALGLRNVVVRVAQCADGAASDGPFDAIILNGATEIEPTKLYEQLRIGGRLVGAFATTRPQRATVVTRSHCDFGTRVLFDASVPVLPSLTRAPAFVF